MYRLLIVDDDPVLCGAMQARIRNLESRYSLGIAFVDCVDCVDDALDYLKSVSADILITDMKMPKKSGLDLIRELAKGAGVPQIIVLSSYDDYQYVRDSFSFGAVDYLLKPVKTDQLLEQLRRCLKNLRQKQVDADDKAERAWQDACRALGHQLGARLVPGQPEEGFTVQPCDCTFAPASMRVAVAAWSGNPAFYRSVARCLWYIRQRGGRDLYLFHDFDSHLVIILPDAEERDTQALLEAVSRNLRERGLPHQFGLSGGGEAEDYQSLRSQALSALTQQLLDPAAAVTTFRPVDQHGDLTAAYEGYLKKVGTFFQMDNYEPLINLVNNIFQAGFFHSADPVWVQRFYECFAIHARESSLSCSMELEVLPLSRLHSLDEIVIYLKEILYKLQRRKRETEGDVTYAIKKSLRYIEDHCGEAVSMHDVAGYACISYTYFSRLFKEQTGKSFSEYLMELRMKKARELLRNPSVKVKDISDRVGYESVNAFSRAFKHYYSISPNDYRQRQIQ